MVDILKNIMNIAYRVRDMQIAGTLSMVLFGVVLVFVFIKDQYQDESVPDWAMKLILDKEDVTDHEH